MVEAQRPASPSIRRHARRHQLSLSLQQPDASHRQHLSRHVVLRWVHAALDADAQLTIRVVDEVEGRALNQSFRRKPYATNVLTFDYARTPIVLADIVLCAPVVAREADAAGRSILAHYAHLVVHGVLHAQGHDHVRAAQARVMEAREVVVMARLGFDNPYG